MQNLLIKLCAFLTLCGNIQEEPIEGIDYTEHLVSYENISITKEGIKVKVEDQILHTLSIFYIGNGFYVTLTPLN